MLFLQDFPASAIPGTHEVVNTSGASFWQSVGVYGGVLILIALAARYLLKHFVQTHEKTIAHEREQSAKAFSAFQQVNTEQLAVLQGLQANQVQLQDTIRLSQDEIKREIKASEDRLTKHVTTRTKSINSKQK